VDTAAAWVRGVIGSGAERADARRALAALISTATAQGMLGQALEARLDLGRLEFAGDDRTGGRAGLRALADDADRRSFHRIAREARAWPSSGPH
jgi:hypothetical protein